MAVHLLLKSVHSLCIQGISLFLDVQGSSCISVAGCHSAATAHALPGIVVIIVIVFEQDLLTLCLAAADALHSSQRMGLLERFQIFFLRTVHVHNVHPHTVVLFASKAWNAC